MPAQRSSSTLDVGRLAGVPIGIQPLWLVIVAFITFALGHDYFPAEDPGLSSSAAYALGLVSALGLFGGLLLALVGALRLGLGGALPAWARALLDYQVLVSAMILAFNLLPAFPLDGGRVARSLLWWRFGDADRATAVAARIGRGFGWFIAALGVVSLFGGAAGGIWLVLVGGFLVFAAGAEARQSRLTHVFGTETVADVMRSPAVVVPASLPLDVAVERFATHLFSAFPVVGETDRVVGVLTIDDVRAIPPGRRGTTCVGAVASADPGLLVDGATKVAQLLRVPAFGRVGRAVVVDGDGRPLGIVSMTDLQRQMRAGDLAPPPARLAA